MERAMPALYEAAAHFNSATRPPIQAHLCAIRSMGKPLSEFTAGGLAAASVNLNRDHPNSPAVQLYRVPPPPPAGCFNTHMHMPTHLPSPPQPNPIPPPHPPTPTDRSQQRPEPTHQTPASHHGGHRRRQGRRLGRHRHPPGPRQQRPPARAPALPLLHPRAQGRAGPQRAGGGMS